MGKTAAEVCIVFGVTKQTLGNWQRLLEAAPAVRKAVDAGEVSASGAAALAKLPREEQMEALEKLKASAPTSGKKAGKVSARKAKAAAGAKGEASRPSLADLRLVREWGEPGTFNLAKRSGEEVMDWVLGEKATKSIFNYTIDQIRKQVEERKSEAAEAKAEAKG
jgi:hypothetical protein